VELFVTIALIAVALGGTLLLGRLAYRIAGRRS